MLLESGIVGTAFSGFASSSSSSFSPAAPGLYRYHS
jgi:hypothetical protein